MSNSKLLLYFLVLITCNSVISIGRNFARYPTCREHKREDDAEMITLELESKPMPSTKGSKGYLGTVGILGGSGDTSGAAYFAGMAALRAGADSVHIYCLEVDGPAIIARGPDITVHPIVNYDWNKVYKLIQQHDVILIGPGLVHEQHNINVINTLIPILKSLMKPLVLDLDEYFISPNLVNMISNYPSPGVILTTNYVEFEKLYEMLKTRNAVSDSMVSIDFEKLGPNVLIFRKGCTDMAMAMDLKSTWSLSEGGTSRRSPGQGAVVAGATATYFHWARTTLPQSYVQSHGSMVAAAVATHSAAKLMRNSNELAHEEVGRSALTSDMLSKIPVALSPGE